MILLHSLWVFPRSASHAVLFYNAIRKEEVIRKFNSVVSSALGSTFEYIDTYSYLMENGYGTNISGTGVDMPDDDGLHYTTKTYKRIFKYCLDYLILH